MSLCMAYYPVFFIFNPKRGLTLTNMFNPIYGGVNFIKKTVFDHITVKTFNPNSWGRLKVV